MIIKSRRMEFEIRDGDTVMDNGCCYQLISRKYPKGWNHLTPVLSKKEFNKFINSPNVKRDLVAEEAYKPMNIKIYTYNSKDLVGGN